MQALHQLIHSLAKEEKRLFHLHRKKARFVSIYDGYVEAPEYSRELDRKIYQKDFSAFSKAFYSMQKNDLLQNLLAVLLEYSNSTRPGFRLVKMQAQYQVLQQKGFDELALSYITSARAAASEAGDLKAQIRVLEDQRDALALTPSTHWEEYSEVLEELSRLRNLAAAQRPLEEEKRKFMVLLQSARLKPEQADEYKRLAHDVLQVMQAMATETARPDALMDIFDCECAYLRMFDDKMAVHRKIQDMDKITQRDNFPLEHKLRITNMAMESSLDVGDFLHVNGLIYRIEREVEKLTEAQRADFMPRFLELSAIYHFYENEMQMAQDEVMRVLSLPDIYPGERVRYHKHKLGILIAGNLPRTAQQALDEMLVEFPTEAASFDARLIQLVIHIEMNNKDLAKALLQKMRNSARKDVRLSGETDEVRYLEIMNRYLLRKPIKSADIPPVGSAWKQLFKADLWLKSKIENRFYYNSILEFWHSRKRVLTR